MNLLLFTDADRIAANQVAVRDARLRHLLEVHRAGVGDTVRLGELGGAIGTGELLHLDDREARIEFRLTEAPPAKLPITLVLALPRPKMLRRILRTVAELGVAELHLINSFRVEKSYWQTPVLGEATTREYLLQGLSQARDTVLPTVHQHRRFKPFVEDQLPALMHDREGLLAHPGDHPPAPNGPVGPSVLVLGPEGGLIPYEVSRLCEAQCRLISLGPRILRVENAVSGLLTRLS